MSPVLEMHPADDSPIAVWPGVLAGNADTDGVHGVMGVAEPRPPMDADSPVVGATGADDIRQTPAGIDRDRFGMDASTEA
jgi:hypothetical protein